MLYFREVLDRRERVQEKEEKGGERRGKRGRGEEEGEED